MIKGLRAYEENKRLAEQNAKVLRNRIIRESEEFIMECRGKNEI